MFQSMQPYLRSWGDIKSWSNKTRDIKGLCKHQFSSRYVPYKDMQWDGKWREDSESVCVVLQQQTKKPEGGKGDGGKKVPFGPSSDLVRAKSISETPWSQTWHGAVSFPWLGRRYLPTIPQGHGASLSQLCSDSLAFHIMSAWSLPQQRGAIFAAIRFDFFFFPWVILVQRGFIRANDKV